MQRVQLKSKIVDSPEVTAVLAERPVLGPYVNSFYEGEYAQFFKSLAELTEAMKQDPATAPHVSFYGREMRIRAYQQFLTSYRSVTLASMADLFGVTAEFLDRYAFQLNHNSVFTATGNSLISSLWVD